MSAGLERALLDGLAFDRLFEIYFEAVGPATTDEPPLPDDLRRRILDGGVGAALPNEVIQLAITPGWLTELWDALSDPAPRPYWETAAKNGFRPAPPSSVPIGERIRAEVAAALSLLGPAPVLDTRRVIDWVFDRVCGPGLPPNVSRQLLTCVAEAVRDIRYTGSTCGDGSTVDHWADGCSIAECAKRIGPVGEAVAAASRGLRVVNPDRADVFVLSAYAERTDAELAALLQTPVAAVKTTRECAEELVRADIERVVGAKIGTPCETVCDTVLPSGVSAEDRSQ